MVKGQNFAKNNNRILSLQAKFFLSFLSVLQTLHYNMLYLLDVCAQDRCQCLPRPWPQSFESIDSSTRTVKSGVINECSIDSTKLITGGQGRVCVEPANSVKGGFLSFFVQLLFTCLIFGGSLHVRKNICSNQTLEKYSL